MSGTKDIYEHLLEQTVHNVLFHEVTEELTEHSTTVTVSSYSVHDIVNKTASMDICEDLLVHMLTHFDKDPAEDDEINNADETRRGSWLLDCPNWSIDRLRREKAAIKRYINAQRQEHINDGQKTMKLNGNVLLIHEVYALLKLFLLERDPAYRQCLEQSNNCTTSFLTSLHLQLTLYATYFERAHGRQISEKADVKPIETLYDFFLTHHRRSTQQQTE